MTKQQVLVAEAAVLRAVVDAKALADSLKKTRREVKETAEACQTPAKKK